MYYSITCLTSKVPEQLGEIKIAHQSLVDPNKHCDPVFFIKILNNYY